MAGAAGIYNAIVEHGASWVKEITYTDSDGNTPDLSSGYTASLVVAQSWDEDDAALLTLTESSGLTLQAAGIIDVVITATQSDALPKGDLVYHLEITKTSSGVVTRLLKGRMKVEAGAA